MSALTPSGVTIVKVMGEMPRGPRREGVFALWLLLRVTEDLIQTPPPPDRATRRRVAALEARLSSLTLPAPLRRALVAALAELKEPRRDQAALVIQQLVAPARESVGSEVAEALSRAARSAAQRLREEPQ